MGVSVELLSTDHQDALYSAQEIKVKYREIYTKS